MRVTETHRSFIPAAGRDWLLPFYDPLTKLLGTASALRELVDQADLEPGHRILDIGCGTGTLAILIKRLHPKAEIVGLDPDPKALARARRKAERARVQVEFTRGFSDDLPFPDASFDRQLSSFMFHHLSSDVKLATLRETRRVLQPGGTLHLLDFGGSQRRSDGLLARLLHRDDHIRDNLEGRIPALMRDAGLADPVELAHRKTIFGTIAFYRARAPGGVEDRAEIRGPTRSAG